jgi:hypothetical protein
VLSSCTSTFLSRVYYLAPSHRLDDAPRFSANIITSDTRLRAPRRTAVAQLSSIPEAHVFRI